MRTTSSLESMNAAMRRSFPNHPHIYKFLDRLRLHEFSKFIDMLDAVQNDAPQTQFQRRKKRDKLRDEKIKCLTQKLKAGELSTKSFLTEMTKEKENVLPDTGKKSNEAGFGEYYFVDVRPIYSAAHDIRYNCAKLSISNMLLYFLLLSLHCYVRG